jgi:hypothetical protein
VGYGGPVVALIPGTTSLTEQVGVAVTLCSCAQEGRYSNFNRGVAYLEFFVSFLSRFWQIPGLDCEFGDNYFQKLIIIIIIIIIIYLFIYYA